MLNQCIALEDGGDFEVVDESAEFFAPVSSDLIDGLIGQYDAERKRIESVGVFMSDTLNAGTIEYFLDGNADRNRGRYSMSLSAKQLFDVKGAVACLNSAYWSKSMSLTDVYDAMPQKRRDEWNTTIREMTAPDFTEDTVRTTLGDLLRMRAQFLGERVDGIFRGLSGEHVTNAPEAFGKRMIIANVLGSFDTSNTSTCGLINDLRCVVAKFMGRDEPRHYASDRMIRELRNNWGQWVTIDGGALKIRLYKKGTAHMELHPDMAWRLNSILASLYPRAIPAEFRQKPKKRAKDYVMLGRPLPFNVLDALASMDSALKMVGDSWRGNFQKIPNTLRFKGMYPAEAVRVIESIGGAKVGDHYQFDYDPTQVISEIVVSGCIPDRQAHQFYPTPEKLARIAVELANIGETDLCCEPSAGQGGIADHLPKERTTCIEIAPLNCAVLKAKGHNVIETDFIVWADLEPYKTCFDVVVMNPPFSDGRAKLHTEYASTKVNPKGRLVAILPASMKGKDFLGNGFAHEWSPIYANEFAGTSVSVVILKATKEAA